MRSQEVLADQLQGVLDSKGTRPKAAGLSV